MTSARTTAVSNTRGNIQSVGLMICFSLLGIVLTGGRVIEGAILGGFLFLVYRVVFVGMILCRHHRRGIGLTKDGELSEALAAFEQSASVWQGRGWLDRNRGWLLGSAARWPFHARALYNQGYCLSRLGRDAEALAVLDALLKAHGDMGMAIELRGAISAARPPADDSWAEMLAEP